MTLIRHECRQGFRSLAIWTVSISAFLVLCIFIYPEMESEMQDMSGMFSSMGAFSDAFGMDRLDFGTLTGFYAVECGNILGIGGAFFSSLLAVSALAKEEKGRTAEFLLTHPVSRLALVTEKLAAVMLQIVCMDLIVFVLPVLSITAIGEPVPWRELCLLHLAHFLVHTELAGICFGISAFLRSSGLGIGLGTAAVMYFMNIIANISDKAEFLQYLTPFGYADGADIVSNACLDKKGVLIGMVFATAGAAAACWEYCRKDIL